MKLLSYEKSSERGFTFAEMAVAIGVLSLLGVTFFQVLNSGLILSAKNTAVNVSHEEARMGVLRMTRDIHAAISVPQLRDNGFTVLSSDPVSGVAPMAATDSGPSGPVTTTLGAVSSMPTSLIPTWRALS